jgi:DnaJ-domain-containing protein 1
LEIPELNLDGVDWIRDPVKAQTMVLNHWNNLLAVIASYQITILLIITKAMNENDKDAVKKCNDTMRYLNNIQTGIQSLRKELP